MHAVDKGHVPLVRPLLEASADIDVRASDGASALFLAVEYGHTEIVSLLMQAGADISVRGPEGETVADAAQKKYGDLNAARQSGEDRAVLALPQGKTLAQVDDEEQRLQHASPQPGASFRDCAGCPEMVVIAAGTFVMGSPLSEGNRNIDEGPRHPVTFSAPFAVGKHEVTRGEFNRFVEETGHATHNRCWTYEEQLWEARPKRDRRNLGFAQVERDPVVCVSWDDAKSYVNWLSQGTGYKYRLLSEAEWEYAARAGTTGPYHFGQNISTDQANYDGTVAYHLNCDGVFRDKTVPVGTFSGERVWLVRHARERVGMA